MKRKNNKKNLIIFPGNFIPNLGGLETHVDELTKYLSLNKRYNITIFTPNTSNVLEREIRHKCVEVIRYPAFFATKNFPLPKFWHPKFYSLFFSLYFKKYDIVMTRTRFFSNSTLGMIFAKFRFKQIKLIHVEHGSEFVSVESKFVSNVSYLYDMIFGKLIFLVSDKNVAVSEISKKFCKKYFSKNKNVLVIKRGVDFEIYDNCKKKYDLRKYDGKLIVFSICRLYKWKGVENTVKAFLELPKTSTNKAVLLIAGDGESFEKIKKVAGKELNKNIFMLGFVEFENAISIFKQGDIFVHSSYPGGALSNSLLQAMYTNCAIIASPNEGANEVIFNNETGILMKGNSPKEISSELNKLILDHKKRDKLSQNAKKFIKKDFDWTNVVKKYEDLFEEVLK